MCCPVDVSEAKIKRVLSLDGGGIKGTQPAAFLATLEEDLGRPIGEYFDLIAGTSTGGIIAIGLALGHPAKEILSLYEDRGPVIFGDATRSDSMLGGVLERLGRRLLSKLRPWFRSKHDASNLQVELEKFLKGARIGDATTRLVIPAWDADRRRPYIYKTAHHERISTDYRQPVVDAALATAAAPTQFKRHRTVSDVGLLDGGTWANNPIAVATVEAIALLNWNPADLRILSLGCTDEVYMLPENPGYLKLKGKILNLLADGQSHGALGMAKLLTRDSRNGQRVFRYAPTVPAGFFAMDDASRISRLKGIGVSAARDAKPDLTPVFFQTTADPFVPVHNLPGATA